MNYLETIVAGIEEMLGKGGEVPASYTPLQSGPPPPIAPRPVQRPVQSGVPSALVPNLKNTSVRLQENLGLLSDNPNANDHANSDELETSNAIDAAKNSVATAPAAASLSGVDYGIQTAQAQKDEGILDSMMGSVSTMLGSIDMDRLLRMATHPQLQKGVSYQETSPYQGFIQRLVETNYLIDQEDAQAAQLAVKQSAEQSGLRSKAELESFKAETDRRKQEEPKYPKPSAEITKMYQSLQASRSGLNLIDKMKAAIQQGTFGVGEDVRSSLLALSSALGYNTELTDKQNRKQLASHIKAQIIASGVFGRDTNRSEHKILDDLVPTSQILDATSKNKMMAAYKLLQDKFSRQARETNNILVNVYGLKSNSEVHGVAGETLLFKDRVGTK
jgi:flagellar biosynthesis chaperone FliJ